MKTRKMRCLAVSGLLLALAALALIGIVQPVAAREAPSYGADYLDGAGSFTLDELRGEVILLNVWATWCEPCKKEMPALDTLAAEYQDQGLRVIGISIDRVRSDADVKAFAAEHGATYTLAKDPQDRFSSEFKTTGVPVTVLVDRSGQIAQQWLGEIEPGSAEVRQAIDAALSADGAVETSTLPRVAAVGFLAAFGAGLLSVLSPCVFPLIPTYAAYITGISVDEMVKQQNANERRKTRRVAMKNGLLFVLGFSLIFVALGASASAIGGWLHEYRDWIARVGGIILLVMGLHMLGVFRIPVLDRIIRPQINGKMGGGRSANPLGTVVVGMAFGAGWTPCIGPALASILTLAAATASMGQGVALLAVYSLGLAVPFLLGTVLIDRFMQRRSGFGPWLPRLERISAVLIIAIGVLMISGFFTQLATWTGGFPTIV